MIQAGDEIDDTATDFDGDDDGGNFFRDVRAENTDTARIRAFGQRGDFFCGDVLRTARRNIERRNRLGVGGLVERLPDMDFADDVHQGGGG